MKRLNILTGPRKRGMACPEGHTKSSKSLNFGQSRQKENRARTMGKCLYGMSCVL